jgi:hypothetical protein
VKEGEEKESPRTTLSVEKEGRKEGRKEDEGREGVRITLSSLGLD